MPSISRRTLLATLASSGLAASAAAQSSRHKTTPAAPRRSADGFLELLREPDGVDVFLGLAQPVRLDRTAPGRFDARGMQVRTAARASALDVHLAAPGARPTHLRLRWNVPVAANTLVLGDHWERSYGDLRWTGLVPERVMPWYFLARHGDTTHAYGLRTGAASLAFWQIDAAGVSLWLNVCNGGSGVELGDRELAAATVVSRRGERGDEPARAAAALCARMCDRPRPLPRVIYGSNDWYYAYGKNTPDEILRDADFMASLAPSHGERPFVVIDDGWQNTTVFPDMAALCRSIRERGVRPGLWIRPLQAAEAPAGLLLPPERFGANRRVSPAYDPTVPDALVIVLGRVKEAVAWGYEMVKHDYSTYELFGRWGSEMKALPSLGQWNFADRTRTNAEIVRDLYAGIRRAAGERTLLIGCNTIGHLAAGLVEIQRTGDDTSGREWERTRRMGVNTLAHRLAQHGRFFFLDPDCVPITTATSWSRNRQWLDLVARSGTALFVSAERTAVGDEQRQALREAFELVNAASGEARPLDWQTSTPSRWEFGGGPSARPVLREYDWYAPGGAWPYEI